MPFPEVPVRLVPRFGYCGIGGQVTDVQRQRVLAVEDMQLEVTAAIFARL
ncbi:hypothetical protein [Streptomyces sp. NPDC048243]